MDEIPMTYQEARDLTDDIGRRGEELISLWLRAFRFQVWAVLGYATWQEWHETEHKGWKGRLKLTPGELTEIVGAMRSLEPPATYREIGELAGVDPKTALNNDPTRSTVENSTNDQRTPEINHDQAWRDGLSGLRQLLESMQIVTDSYNAASKSQKETAIQELRDIAAKISELADLIEEST